MEEKNTVSDKRQVDPGYALFQIAKAFTTSKQHEDVATRERAQAKVEKWTAVINGIFDDTLDIGSRSPVEGVPNWVTLEVVTGGFATGELLAGGPLLDHERDLAAKFIPSVDANERQALNAYYLTDGGLQKLQEQLLSGCYDVAVPEEGALLVVAWLVKNGHVEEGRNLLDKLIPFFSRLRFYPIPRESPSQSNSQVHLQDVDDSIYALQRIQPNQQILAQREAIQIWIPLYDEMVNLFLETVKGEIPNLRGDSNEKWKLPNGKYLIDGGWPCQNYPEGWQERAKRVIKEYKVRRTEHQLCGKPERAKDSFAQLYKYLCLCVEAPDSLSGCDVGRVRLILARYVAKRGVPGSSKYNDIRQRQRQQADSPLFYDISRVVISRLKAYPEDDGIDNLEEIVQPITAEETMQWKIEANTLIPESQQKKVRRCLNDTIEHLVELGVITSSESLARVLPQITSDIRSSGLTDAILRQLYAVIYRAFRRRRSLLLLNLESQTNIEELPWVAAIDRFRNENPSTQESSKHTLEEVTRLAITSFPHTILPNKLLQELRVLAKGAGLEIPLVDEIAADIFMGTFSNKFCEAAKQAGEMLEGTLYEKYYGIDYRLVRQIPKAQDDMSTRYQSAARDYFAELCTSQAGVTYSNWDPAINGMIIEQQQIYTSQNLAILFDTLNLKKKLKEQLEELAQDCFIWICRRQQLRANNRHARLIMVKNTAYAWRQMIFFLALLPQSNVETFLIWADKYLKGQKVEFQDRFRPALQGLFLATAGHSLDDSSINPLEVRRFLGWSKERHWLFV